LIKNLDDNSLLKYCVINFTKLRWNRQSNLTLIGPLLTLIIALLSKQRIAISPKNMINSTRFIGQFLAFSHDKLKIRDCLTREWKSGRRPKFWPQFRPFVQFTCCATWSYEILPKEIIKLTCNELQSEEAEKLYNLLLIME